MKPRLERSVGGYAAFWLGDEDPRVYALLRVAFSSVALINLLDLWPHRLAFFSAKGMIDLETLRAAVSDQPCFSLFHYVSSPEAVTALFVFSGLAIVCLGLGIFPRAAAICVFVWHLSYTYRAFPVILGWDEILRLVAFIIMISPMDGTWTIQARFPRGFQLPKRDGLPRYGLVLLQIQLAVIYWQAVWLKTADPHWRNGEFFSYFMLSAYAHYPHRAMADQQLLSCLLTYGTLVIEALVPVLLFFRRSRLWGFSLGAALHLGIAMTSVLWIFSLVTMVPYLAFLDRRDLTQVISWVKPVAPLAK